ncbi:MAG: tRNA threonylcarbamoyladenosine dehydratase [Paramuribaculum sp.]|nr:tRNA threonylcarbamoyladenosine dehydratase [Paramuribaculum sp.]
MVDHNIFSRVERLTGRDAMEALHNVRVIIFGVGGVGSWTAEALVRTGIMDITIVDADVVAASNINRQLMATVSTIGRSKVEVLCERLLDINPDARIKAIHQIYSADTACLFNLSDYDYVVDAIDSLTEKAMLILNAEAAGVKLYSSMGAALKLDPTKVEVAKFRNVSGCRLAAALRRKFRMLGMMPKGKFETVFSQEFAVNRGEAVDDSGAMTYGKVAYNGALCHITAIFGMTLAGLIIRDITSPFLR